MREKRFGLLLATCAIGCCWLAWPAAAQVSPASGQTVAAATSGQGGLEEVTVTARKFTENNQSTPVSITAFTAEALASHNIVNLGDLATETPSLVAEPSTYDPFDLYINIRGQRSDTVLLSQTPAVGIYVDDVYMPSTVGTQVGNLMDVSEIEVLKGAQGTLYGRNTTGGAVKIATIEPQFDKLDGQVQVGAGNYDETEIGGVINVPLASNAAFRIWAQRTANDGYGIDTVHERALESLDSRNVRLAFRVKPNDSLDIILRADYNDVWSGGLIDNVAYVQPGATLANLNAAVARGYLTLPQAFNFFGVGAVTPADLVGLNAGYNAMLAQAHDGSFNETYSELQSTRLRSGGGSATVVYDLNNDLTLKSISAYRYFTRVAYADTDGTSFAIIDGPADSVDASQFTQEFQLGGRALNQRLNWTAGYFYYRQSGTDNSVGEILFGALPLGASPLNQRNHDEDDSNSVYGQMTYALMPDLHLTGGLRWTTENIGLISSSSQGAGEGQTCIIPGLTFPACSASYNSSFRNVSYSAGPDWNVTPDVLLYAKTNRGFKSGGFNQEGALTGTPFAPEVVTDYEIGAKTEWYQHKLRVNVAAYHTNYNDIQRTVVESLGGGSVASVIRNAASARIDGLELEVKARPTPELTLGASGSYTRAKYQKYENDGVNLAGIPFADTPKWEGTLSSTYLVPLSFGAVSTTLDYNFISRIYFQPDAATINSGTFTQQASYGLMNARSALNLDSADLTIELWGKNLLDRRYNAQANDFSGNYAAGAIGIIVTQPGAPRTFGIRVTKRF